MFRLRFFVVPVAALAFGGSVFAAACASDDPGSGSGGPGTDASLLGDAAIPMEAAVPAGDICGNASGVEHGSAWPMAGGCPKRAGVALHTGAQAPNVKWTTLLPAGSSAPAISADSVTWFGTTDGDIAGVTSSGTSFGAVRTGGAVKASPVRSASGLTIVGSTDGTLYAVVGGVQAADAGADAGDDAAAIALTARVVWSRAVGPMTSSPMIGGDGTIYVGLTSGQLVAVAGDGSATKWMATTNDTGGSSPSIAADGTIYVGSSDQKLYAISPEGAVKWSFQTGGAIAGAPAVGGDETVYVGSADGKLYAVLPDGTAKWSFATGGPITTTPAVLAASVVVGSTDKKLHSVDVRNGEQFWEFTTLGEVGSPSIASDATIYVGSTDGNVYAIDPSGLLYFATKAKGKVSAAPAIGADGTISVSTDTSVISIGR